MLGEADLWLPFLEAQGRGERVEDVVHDGAAQASEDYEPVENEEDIIPAQGKSASGGIVVGDAEELLGVTASIGNECVYEE